MKEKFNIEQPHLKENPYSVPEGYFSSFQSNISEIISHKDSKAGVWMLIKPQLALVSTFAVIFLMGYVAITIFSPNSLVNSSNSAISKLGLLEEAHLETSFIDFFDEETDSLTQKAEINPEEIIEYLNTDAGLMYLASLE
ncbi:MAG: hypothetical protein ABFC28_06395 [Rikenellaceae bacterium]